MGDIFLNLSHLLLSNIVKYIERDNDRIIFNDSLDTIEIPDEKKQIIFGNRLSQLHILTKPFSDRLACSNVDTLSISDRLEIRFDQFPSTIKSLSLSQHSCSKDFKWLPESLEKLCFYNQFHQQIITQFQSTIRHLEFSENYNSPIAIRLLPPQLEVLICRNAYLPKFDGSDQLPSTLTKLDINTDCVRLLSNCNLPALSHLILNMYREYQLKQGDIPMAATKLSLIQMDCQLHPEVLTSQLRHIEFHYGSFKLDRNVFSHLDRLETLLFSGACTNSLILGKLPASLKVLELPSFTYKFVISEICEIPGRLDKLTITFNSLTTLLSKQSLPKSLVHLHIYQGLEPVVVESLPDDLESMEITGSNFIFESSSYPSSLRSLTANKSFFENNSIIDLPTTIVQVTISTITNYAGASDEKF
ncbi:hypothetical protein PPL_06091 [Heterostelium album PN500]|uniref:Uncharacterized protein n=1 Tax=Heterostelium pallidum (strain ATCC 26659 / Pp 5 / PN500) TaxID=670386 RepID=D3BC69_HETP5|nr:hypothetical protein PPL_06091 [Heterostelium album PN500]EFA81252.1 hypothetical protein PPL_06091 [Heterostelium album PN500]|eukprot:XP_020433370.1 hypothetical protein PPL_06091 [Heterostelium album PN500]